MRALMLLFVSLSLLLTAAPAYADRDHRGRQDSIEDLEREVDRQHRRMANQLADMERIAAQLPPSEARNELFVVIDSSRELLKRMARTDSALLDAATAPRRGGTVVVHPPLEPVLVAVSPDTLDDIRRAVQNRPFDDDRMAILKDATASRLFTAVQVKELVKLFSFSSGKVGAAVWLHARTIDPENFYVVYDALTFPSDRDELRDRIGGPR